MRVRGSIDVGLGAQKDCDHIVLLSPYNQHHHRPHGRIRVDIQWNCDRIIFLSETGRNNWSHRPPSGSTILCRLIMQQIMTLENRRERKFLIRFFLPLGRSFFVGGLRCWQIGRVAYCGTRHKDHWWARKQGSGAVLLWKQECSCGQDNNNLLKSEQRMSTTKRQGSKSFYSQGHL